MADNLLLMMKDIPVIRINFDYGVYEVLSEVHVPYQMKGRLRSHTPTGNPDYDNVQIRVAERRSSNAVISFLASRVLPLDRENAKKVLNLLRMTQEQDPFSKAKIAITCRAVSLQDHYWVKLEKDGAKWQDVDLRQNSLSEIVAQVALHGTSLTLDGQVVSTPEISTHGAYAKCWKREEDGLYLYKRGYDGNTESKIEVEVSGILDKCNVDHLKYETASDHGVFCCKCKCMTDQTLSMLNGGDFIAYCNANDMDWYAYALELDKEAIYKMFIVDYLISNRDRHGMNWGFYYNCNTMEILSCHPLYDHNNSFDRETMKDDSGGDCLLLDHTSLKKAALLAMQSVDFHFTDDISRDDFLVESHYESFKKRAETLGLNVL